MSSQWHWPVTGFGQSSFAFNQPSSNFGFGNAETPPKKDPQPSEPVVENRPKETKNQMNNLRLSAMFLGESVSIANLGKQFTFIVGKDEREHTCSLVQACFISGKVRRLVSCDLTMNSLRVLPVEECDVFELIERLWNGDSINIDINSVEPLLKLGRELENEELISFLVNWDFSGEDISIDNCLSRLHLKAHLGLDSREEIEFIASNFSSFSIMALSSLTVSEFECILSHESLKIEDENSLFDYILMDLVSRDESSSSLFKYIQFEYLDSEHLDLFLDVVCPENIDCVWDSIANFIRKSAKKPPKKRPAIRKKTSTSSPGGKVFTYDESEPLMNGIISYLRKVCGGNPHSRGIIHMTDTGGTGLERIVDVPKGKGIDSDYMSRNTPNSWIQFDFKERSVSVESYSIKSDMSTNMLQWKLEGSNDATSWTELDSQDTDALRSGFTTSNFTCTQTDETFRYIRLTQTGLNCATKADHRMALCRIEFFGTVTE